MNSADARDRGLRDGTRDEVAVGRGEDCTSEVGVTPSPRVASPVSAVSGRLTTFVSPAGASSPTGHGSACWRLPCVTVSCVVGSAWLVGIAAAVPASTGASILSRWVSGITVPTAVYLIVATYVVMATLSLPSSRLVTLASAGLLPVSVVITGITRTLPGPLT